MIKKIMGKVKGLCIEIKHPYDRMVTSYTGDNFFRLSFEEALKQTKSKNSIWKRDRFYNLVHFLESTANLPGEIVECGCFQGMSSYLMMQYLRRRNSSFKGKGYHIYDSFQGLSKPNLDEEKVLINKLEVKSGEGLFFAPESLVKNNLKDFPEVEYHVGFIPDTLSQSDPKKYKFVHIDLDLVVPTISAIEHFYPRLVDGGIIVSDDYGSYLWPETQKAVDELCALKGYRLIPLTTGQCVIIK